MCLAGGSRWTQRQQRLCTVECLYLAFFINTKNNRLVGRIYIKTDNIAEFLDKVFVTTEFECLDQMRFEVVSFPYTTYSGFTDTLSFGHTPCTPMGRVGRRCVKRCFNDSVYFFLRYPWQAARTGSVFLQSRQPQ